MTSRLWHRLRGHQISWFEIYEAPPRMWPSLTGPVMIEKGRKYGGWACSCGERRMA